MGTRSERLKESQAEMERGPAPVTKATEGEIRPRPKTPLICHLLGTAGLGLVLLDLPIVWVARSHGWRVTDGVIIVMVALFVGGIGLVGMAAIIRQQAARRDT